MTDKFTLRDFLVFFLNGVFMLITLLYEFNYGLLDFFKIDPNEIEKNSTVTVFLLVPGLYILGQFIHGLDLFFFKLGRICNDFMNDHKILLEKCKLKILFKFFNYVINGNRVTGILDEKDQNIQEFWRIVSKLQCDDKFNKSEYWYLTKDMFSGFSSILFFWSIYYCFVENDFLLVVISFTLALTCWYRARYMAANFITTVMNTYNALEKQITSANK